MKKYMKYTLALILALTLACTALLTASCGEESEQEGEQTTTTTTNGNFDDIPVAKDIQCSGSLADQDGNAIPGAAVQFTQNGAVISSFTTDAEGKFSGTVKEGKYTVTYENLPEGHLGISSEVTVSESESTFALTVENNTPNGSAERPYFLSESVTAVTLPAGATVHYSSFAGVGRTFIIESSSVTVTFRETEYTPDENGTVSFPVTADDSRDQVIFAVKNATDGELSLNIVLLSPLGSMDNPHELTLDTEISAEVPKDGIVYYSFAATAAGKLTMSSTDANNNIAITNRTTSKVTEFSNGGASLELEVAEGDEIMISVSSLALADSTVVFTMTLAEGE